MNEYAVRIEQLRNYFDEKKLKRYKLQTFINLVNKLGEVDDSEINVLISNAFNLLQELSRDQEMKPREYLKAFSSLQKEVRKKYGYTEKDQVKNEMIGMGIALGVAFGGAFVGINPAFSGIGLPIGLAIGAAIGTTKEKEAEEAGKTY